MGDSMIAEEHGASAERPGGGLIRLVLENVVVLGAYWGVSHLNWMVFKSVGVLPMPIWPAAAVALVAAVHLGWRIAPGIALGTILANHISLPAPLNHACYIAMMNTLGPVLAAAIIRRSTSGKSWLTWNRTDVTVLFLAGVVLAPVLTAAGGIGSAWLLGLMSSSDVPRNFMRWGLAHALGALLFAPPLLAWLVRGAR